jgi:DnaJ-domain-containing protein 1
MTLAAGEILVVIMCAIIGYGVVWSILTIVKRKAGGDAAKDEAKGENAETVNEALDWFQILEVLPDATDDEIRRAYYKKMMQYHPDKVETLGPEFKRLAETRTQEINRAYETARRTRRA